MVDSPRMPATSWASSEAARASMRGNRSRDTAPELAVRRLLHAEGRRYRVNYRPVAGLRRTADVVFTRARVAVFIDGCFWHGCPLHYQAPVAHRDYWEAKAAGNRARDADTAERLAAAGWTVLRFWEHEQPASVVAAIDVVLDAASAGRG
ncbi:very short patch repair endonuclease [Microterricola viridarii]|nr:very short patch repair endonuclease [Microterricola viridarii]